MIYKDVYTQPYSEGDTIKLNPEYFLNYGVFLGYDDVISDIMCVDKHYEYGENKGKIEKVFLNPHKANYVIGNIPALVTYMLDDNEAPLIQLLYINEKEKTTVAIHNDDLVVFNDEYEEISRFKYSQTDEYSSPPEGAIIHGNTVYFWRVPNLLHSFDIEARNYKNYECFIPGLSVVGCDFRNAKMSSAVKKMLNLHGGRVN